MCAGAQHALVERQLTRLLSGTGTEGLEADPDLFLVDRCAEPVLEPVLGRGRRTLFDDHQSGLAALAQPFEPICLRRPVHERHVHGCAT